MKSSYIYNLIVVASVMSLVACSRNTIDQEINSFDDEQVLNDGSLWFAAAEEGEDLDIFDDYFGSNNASRAEAEGDYTERERVISCYKTEGATMSISAKRMRNSNVATRAERVSSFTADSKLSVFGYYCEDGVWDTSTATPDIFYNQELENSTGSFKYYPLQYWPAVGGIKFFGAYPNFGSTDQITLTSSQEETGFPTVEFSASANSYEQQDFMTATTDVLTYEQGEVPLNLKHRLARIAFKIHNGYMATNITIKKIELGNSDPSKCVMCSADGVYTDSNTNTINNPDNTHNTDGFVWSNLGSAQVITAQNADGSYLTIPSFISQGSTSETYVTGSNYIQTLSSDWQITLLPQTLTDVPLTLYYTMGDDPTEKTLELKLNLDVEQSYEYMVEFVLKDKETYVDVDEEGNLVIDIDAFNAFIAASEGSSTDFTVINEVLDIFRNIEDATVRVLGEPLDYAQTYHLLTLIVDADAISNYDMSDLIIPENTLFNDGNLFKNGPNSNPQTMMKSIKLPALDDIQFGNNTFQNCTALESVTFHEGSTFTELPINTFNGCTALKEVVNLSEISTLTTIVEYAFSGCVNLPEVVLPSSVESIGYAAFQNCKSFTQLDLMHTNLTTLAGSAYNGCTSIEEVKLPSTLSTMEKAFGGCTALRKFDVSTTQLTELCTQAFSGLPNLEEVLLPSSITYIGKSVFANCPLLSKINIPASLSANLPNDDKGNPVPSIDYQAFFNCVSLYSYEHDGIAPGITFEDRAGADPITLGWQCFVGSHVRYEDTPAGYINSNNISNGYFEEP